MKQRPSADPSFVDDPLLTLRFQVPRPPALHLERRRLVTRLQQGADRPLTLVTAPAGSGKTTLVASWVAERDPAERLAWLTFEAGDHGAQTFWPLLVEALRRCGAVLRYDAVAGAPDPHRRMLVELCAALCELERPVTVVLDGCEVTDAGLGDDLAFLLQHSDRRLRLVMLTRADPVMPLHRLRLEDLLTELRMVDLAFSEEETGAMIQRAGVRLSPTSLTTLLSRTRGWAAGLRFAVMLLERSEDPAQTVDYLAGDTGNIAEYLMAEILEAQPKEARDLLLRTSVVDVLQPGLIEALGGPSAARRLAALARANVLVEEVADHPGWFQYHPFLRHLLRAELAYASPRNSLRLHRRAARWYASRGAVPEAVALSAVSAAWGDAVEYAIDGLVVGRLVMGDDADGLVHALRRMPPSTTGHAAAAVRAALALADKNPERCAAELSNARTSAEAAGADADSAVQLAIDVIETVRCGAVDPSNTVAFADRAARRLAARTDSGSGAHRDLAVLIQTTKGVAQFRAGGLGEAEETLSEAMRAGQDLADCTVLRLTGLAHLALIAALEGRLRRAEKWAAQALALADEIALPAGERPREIALTLALVGTERLQLVAAGEQVKSLLRSPGADPIEQALSGLVRGRLLRAGGEVEKAVKALDEARRGLSGGAEWLSDRLLTETAEARLAQGRPDLATPLLDVLHLPEEEAALLTLGRTHLLRGAWDDLADTLAALTGAGRSSLSVALGSRLLAAAQALHGGHDRQARVALEGALRLGAGETARLPFRDAPTMVRALLEADSGLLEQHRWLHQTSATVPSQRSGGPVAFSPILATTDDGELIEPLTAKELEVLGHLAELLSTQEIADAMFVSVNTVRTHVRSVLRKLAVSRRNEAVRRARALKLLAA